MSGSTIGGIIGGGIGFLFGGPAGARWGFMIGSTLGGIVDPQKIYGPKLSDASRQTAAEGVPIPFGYGTFPVGGHLIYCSDTTPHERKEGGKGGPVQVTYYYTRTYAIGVCEGEADIVQVKRNGKLVYDITPTSTIRGKNAKFLRNHTLYRGTETQTVDPSIEAIVGIGNTPPYLGTCYLVADDVECPNAAAVDTYEFVVQKCGAVTSLADSMQMLIAALDSVDSVASVTRTGTWTSYPAEIPGNVSLQMVAADNDTCIAFDTNEAFYYSTDRGVNWTAATDQPNTAARLWKHMAFGPNVAMALAVGTGADAGKSYIGLSYNDGNNWTYSELTGIIDAERIGYGAGIYVIVTGDAGGIGNGIFTAIDPSGTWTNKSSVKDFNALHFNGTNWMAVGASGKTYTAPASAETWTHGSTPGGGSYSFVSLTGGDGFFVAGATTSFGIYRTTNLGVTWTNVYNGGTHHDTAAAGLGVVVVGGSNTMRFSVDDGLTWTNYAPPAHVNAIAYMGPRLNWYTVPDGDNLYADENGVLVDDYADTSQASSCVATLSDIVADLCDRAGIDATEYDVSGLTDSVKGYRCATESSATGFIEPLAAAFFFDRGEWDKKLRFIKRGGASVASLTMDDLVMRDGPAIEQEQTQEADLLRKVNVMTLDPAAGYVPGKQTWERRAGTVVAVGESTIEIPIVTDVDTAAQIAEKRGKIAWAESEKFKFGVSVKYSKLTPTDIVTLTDRAAKVHRLRLSATNEDSGVFEAEEAIKDRASTYSSTAVGTGNGNLPPVTEGLVGPTLFVAMNLPQLRNQDATAGVYVGACGILAGWPGCQILLSVDGGLSYTVALTITEPSTLGYLTANFGISASPSNLSVHVFGGALESKTPAQVAAGANLCAIDTSGTAEVLSFETAVEGVANYYALDGITRALYATTQAAHVADDDFLDLNTAYFIPIPQAYAGDTLYFKAVGIGLSADDVDPVTLVYSGLEYIYDGGGAA